MNTRQIVKILHTIAAGGLIGGLACHMFLLAAAPQETPAAYADLRALIAALSNYILMPSLGLALVSGLLSMVVHTPFLDKGWVWLKALMGILMFKGVLLLVVAEANSAATAARTVANGEEATSLFTSTLYAEWAAIGVVMALSIANVVFGVWRPRLIKPFRPTAEALQLAKAASAKSPAAEVSRAA